MPQTEMTKHAKYGMVEVLQRTSALVQIETEDGNQFWVPSDSFTPVKKKAVPRKKKAVQAVRKVDEIPDLADDLAAITSREELPDVLSDESMEDLLSAEGAMTVEEILASIQKDRRETIFSCAEHNPLKLGLAMGLIKDAEV
jgi:hypothetical protein